MTPVRLEPAAPRSRVRHSTTEPLRSLLSKRPKIGFQDQFLLNGGQKYCRMLQGEHSAILSTSIKLPFVIKIFVLSIFEWPLKTGFTVFSSTVTVKISKSLRSLKSNNAPMLYPCKFGSSLPTC